MKKYSFQMTEKETLELCSRAIWEELRLSRSTWLKIVGIIALESIIMPWVGLLIFLFLLMVMAVYVGRSYIDIKEKLCGKMRVLWVEEGVLKMDTEGDIHSEIPCSKITEIRTTRHLLLLGWRQSPKRIGWYPVPLREFADQQERDVFLEAIKNSQTETAAGTEAAEDETAIGMEAVAADSDGRAIMQLSFCVEEERWKQILMDTTEILRSGTLGNKKQNGLALGMIAVVCLGISGWAIWRFPDAGRGISSVVFIAAVVCLALLRVRKENPAKRIQKQMKRGLVQNNVYGDWEIVVTDTGISQNGPCRDSVLLPWRHLCCLVETDTGLYFFQQDKRHFVPLPKECMEGWEQTEALKALCREKGLAILFGKKMRYAPGWFYSAMIAAAFVLYVGVTVGLAFGNSTEDIEVSTPVSLEEQVAVLRSFGFTVHQDIVEGMRESIKDKDIGNYVEKYPYTWLLVDLALLDYGEEGDTDKVFWFDFEGWDISTDYIRVLEGMRKLASGSILDDVENIREDTENVNWERGTGKITVSLEWNGGKYSWQMDMEHDWIDGEILRIYNGLLEKEDVPERFYVTGDDGQGALVFFCTREWAEEFEEATGLEMESYTVKKGW